MDEFFDFAEAELGCVCCAWFGIGIMIGVVCAMFWFTFWL